MPLRAYSKDRSSIEIRDRRKKIEEEEGGVRQLPALPTHRIVPVGPRSESSSTLVEQVADLAQEVLTPDEKRQKSGKIRDYIIGRAEYLVQTYHGETSDKFRELRERENDWILQDDNIKKLNKLIDDPDMSGDEALPHESAREIAECNKSLQGAADAAEEALERLRNSESKNEADKAHKRFKRLRLPENLHEYEWFERALRETTDIKNNYIQEEINIYDTFLDKRHVLINELEGYSYKKEESDEESDEESHEVAVPQSDTWLGRSWSPDLPDFVSSQPSEAGPSVRREQTGETASQTESDPFERAWQKIQEKTYDQSSIFGKPPS